MCIAAGFMTLTAPDHFHFHQVFIDKAIRSGVHVFELAFEHTEDILNTDFSCV